MGPAGRCSKPGFYFYSPRVVPRGGATRWIGLVVALLCCWPPEAVRATTPAAAALCNLVVNAVVARGKPPTIRLSCMGNGVMVASSTQSKSFQGVSVTKASAACQPCGLVTFCGGTHANVTVVGAVQGIVTGGTSVLCATDRSRIAVARATFNNNQASSLRVQKGASLVVDRCNFTGGTAIQGGGIFATDDASLAVSGCTF